MAIVGQTELVAALQVLDFGRVTGTPESGWIDFKRDAYPMTKRGKWELCKDVAAFANADGGCIVLGFDEVLDPVQGIAVAGASSPIEVSTIDRSEYLDVIESGIFPPPTGVELTWFATGEPPAGALLLSVRSNQSEKPHVMRRVVTEDGEGLHAFAIPLRVNDRVNWMPAETVHHLLRQAQQGVPADIVRGPVLDGGQYKQKLALMQDWESEALYWLQAMPSSVDQPLRGFYDEVRQLLERPPSIRDNGFNIRSIGGVVDVIEGCLVVHRANDAAAWLTPEGVFTVGVLASPDFLGWGLERLTHSNVMMINSLCLTELTMEFCRFVWLVMAQRSQASHWTLSVECQQFAEHKVVLPSGLPPMSMPLQVHGASADEWLKVIQGTSVAGDDAFLLLSNVYALFGLPESAIPLSTDRSVQVERILQSS